MRIGTRWGVGAEPPSTLHHGIRQAIRDEEQTLEELGADTADWGWTLTYLEGEPVVTLDDGTVITNADGEIQVTHEA